jgi:ABC-2 type transport system permease protein
MIELFLAELKRTWILQRRYPIEVIGIVIVTVSIFYGLFLSARYVAGANFQLGDRLDSIVIGYVLWSLLIFIMGNIANRIQYEAQTGTIEQLFLSRFGAVQIFLMRAFASVTLQIVFVLSILLAIMFLTGSRLNFPPVLLLPLTTVLMGANGIAFVIGSLALLFKQVNQLQVIFQFAILFLIATPTESWTGWAQVLANLLPIAPSAGILRDLMAREESLNLTHLIIAFVNGAIYFAIGLGLFRLAERQAKRRGILGGY